MIFLRAERRQLLKRAAALENTSRDSLEYVRTSSKKARRGVRELAACKTLGIPRTLLDLERGEDRRQLLLPMS